MKRNRSNYNFSIFFSLNCEGGLDLMIVPGLAFTSSGQRLGSGKGYYDFYLDRCQHDPHGRPYTIGLALRQQIFRSLPMDVHDVELDEVIYPDEHDTV